MSRARKAGPSPGSGSPGGGSPGVAAANGALALLVELGLVVAALRAGLALLPGRPAGWGVGVGLAGAVALIWARFAAPRSGHRLDWPALGMLKATLFSLGTLGWALSDGWPAACVFAIAAAVSLRLSSLCERGA